MSFASCRVESIIYSDDFGFDHILWVYSHRRGVDCWVCDGKARRLNNEQRSANADYFRVYKGNNNSKSKVSVVGPALHPFLVRSSSGKDVNVVGWEQLKQLLGNKRQLEFVGVLKRLSSLSFILGLIWR
ncbi:hypothetical protein L2E82_39723 [Cichorium intybus]|uniref:Uncharacterized protein n=1 Tax=Cichorium intybus TaxID=13427 RepID=A0ACB9AKR4_CICIN|nr:hypothetical protein L2E82_39723 [Cichorium intybus]